MMIHQLADVNKDAKIAENVTVSAFTSIAEDVEIGAGTWIGPNVTIMDGARIGKNCRIFPGAVIAAIPQDLKFAGEKTWAIIGDKTTIRECATINRGTNATSTDKETGATRIGNHGLIMAYVHVAHDCTIGNHCIIANSVQLAGHVSIGDYASIGGVSAVHQFVRIGMHTMIAGGSLVRKNIPPYIKVAREPISYIGMNTVGLTRRGFTTEQIDQIHDIYRILYTQGYNTTDALKVIKTTPCPVPFERDAITAFIDTCLADAKSRGIVKSKPCSTASAKA